MIWNKGCSLYIKISYSRINAITLNMIHTGTNMQFMDLNFAVFIFWNWCYFKWYIFKQIMYTITYSWRHLIFCFLQIKYSSCWGKQSFCVCARIKIFPAGGSFSLLLSLSLSLFTHTYIHTHLNVFAFCIFSCQHEKHYNMWMILCRMTIYYNKSSWWGCL